MHPDAIFWRVVSGELPLPPAAQTLGWQFLEYDDNRQEASVAYDVPASLTNPLGNIQGGILSAMLDDCMGPAVYAGIPPNRIALTVESKTLFIRPASPGRDLAINWIRCSLLNCGTECWRSVCRYDESNPRRQYGGYWS